MKRRVLCFVAVLLIALTAVVAVSPDYSDKSNWAYFAVGEDSGVDL